MGVIKVLEDSDNEFYEAARRTPRKVHFGGESIKMRTPESDSNNSQEDSRSSSVLKITVTDAISIQTRKSLIPIRVTSLPSTPRKVNVSQKKRLHESAPNLNSYIIRSKIPLKQKQQISKEKKDGTKTGMYCLVIILDIFSCSSVSWKINNQVFWLVLLVLSIEI